MVEKIIHKKVVFKTLIFGFLFLVLQIFGSYFLIREISIQNLKGKVLEYNTRIESDLKIENGKWDTTFYNSDPLTPLPNQSGNTPLYVITNEGFVIDRSSPVRGFLDTSDYKRLLNFETPQNIETLANESWRIKSKKIVRNNEEFGVITVAYFSPDRGNLSDIDRILDKDLNNIDSYLELLNNEITIGNFDTRHTHYEVAFEIVSKYNKVLVNNGRIPTFIDPSYVEKQSKEDGFKIIKDIETGKDFITYSKNVFSDGKFMGVIVNGESIESIKDVTKFFLLSNIGFTLFISIPLFIATVRVFRKEISDYLNSTSDEFMPDIDKISFNPENGELKVNSQKYEIAYASNQYYLCKICFSDPHKGFEADEILEEMGEGFEEKNSRKIYDASLAINKKLGLKLILHINKRFQINPQFLPAVQ